jgi:hypothetical protein
MGDAKLSAELWPQNEFKQAAVSQEDPHLISSDFQFSGVPAKRSSSGLLTDWHRIESY